MKHLIQTLLNHTQAACAHNLRSQQGRSMVEMLGVLVVIGVLSITAVLGYSYAMNKHRANIILEDVKRIAVFVVSSDFMQKEDGVIEDLNVEVESDTPYEVAKETEKTFYITAGEIDKKICAILVREKPTYAEEIVANAMDAKVCQEGENEIYFYVNADMQTIDDADKPEACSAEVPCSGCSECLAGRCVDKNEKCSDGQYCVDGICECPNGQIKNKDGICEVCGNTNIAINRSDASECLKCSFASMFIANSSAKCFPCPAGTTPTDQGCTGCPAGELWHSGGRGETSLCKKCIDTTGVITSLSECNKCSDHYAAGRFEAYTSVGCYNCDNPYSWALNPTTLEQCNRCSNRYLTATKSCELCPAGQVKNAAGTGCEGCPNGQFWNTGGGGSLNQCSTCSNQTGAFTSQEECHKCSNQFVGVYSNTLKLWGCYGCLITNKPNSVTLAECNRCPTRYLDTATTECKLCPTGQVKNAAGTGCV